MRLSLLAALLVLSCTISNCSAFILRLNGALSRTLVAGSGKEVTVLNEDNGKSITIPAGSPLSLACVRTEMRLSFQCKAGSCGSCVSMLDGKEGITLHAVE